MGEGEGEVLLLHQDMHGASGGSLRLLMIVMMEMNLARTYRDTLTCLLQLEGS